MLKLNTLQGLEKPLSTEQEPTFLVDLDMVGLQLHLEYDEENAVKSLCR